MNEIDLQRIVVSIMGDGSHYKKTMNDVVRITKEAMAKIHGVTKKELDPAAVSNVARHLRTAARLQEQYLDPKQHYKIRRERLNDYYQTGLVNQRAYLKASRDLERDYTKQLDNERKQRWKNAIPSASHMARMSSGWVKSKSSQLAQKTADFGQRVGNATGGSIGRVGTRIRGFGTRLGLATSGGLRNAGNWLGRSQYALGQNVSPWIRRSSSGLGRIVSGEFRGAGNWLGRTQFGLGSSVGGPIGNWIASQARRGNLGSRALFNSGNPLGGFIGRTGASLGRGISPISNWISRQAKAGNLGSRALFNAGNPIGGFLGRTGGIIGRGITNTGLALNYGTRGLGSLVGKGIGLGGSLLGGTISSLPMVGKGIAFGFTGARTALNAFGSGLSTVVGGARSVFSSVSNGFQQVGQSIHNSVGQLQNFGLKLRTAGVYASMMITAPVVALGSQGLGEYRSFDKAMTEMEARAGGGITKLQRKGLEKLAIDHSTSGKVAFSPTEIASTYQELAAAGLESDIALRAAMPLTTLFAQAGEFSPQEGTSNLLKILSASNVDLPGRNATQQQVDSFAVQMQHYSDMIIGASNLSLANPQNLTKAVTRFAPEMRQYGMGITEASAVLGAYADAGFEGEHGGEVFGRNLRLMKNTYRKKESVWKEQGLDIIGKDEEYKPFIDVLSMIDKKISTGGKEGGRMLGPEVDAFLLKLGFTNVLQHKAMKPLFDKSGIILKDIDKMGDMEKVGGGQTAVMAAKQMEALENQIKSMRNEWSALSLELGDLFRPAIDAVIVAIRQTAKFLRELDPATKAFIISFLGMAATIGPILLLVGSLAAVVVALVSSFGFLLGPIGLLFAPGGLLVAGIGLLALMRIAMTNWNMAAMWESAKTALGGFINNAIGFATNFRQNMGILFAWLQERWTAFGVWSTGMWTLMFQGITVLINKFLPSISDIWAEVMGGQAFVGFGDALVGGLNKVVGFIVNLPGNLTLLFTWIKDNWTQVWDYAGEYASIIFEHLGEGAIRIFNVIGSSLISAFTPVVYGIMSLFRVAFGDMLRDVISISVGALQSIVNLIPDSVAIAFPALGALKTFLGGVTGSLTGKTNEYLDTRSAQEQLRIRDKYMKLRDAEPDQDKKMLLTQQMKQEEAAAVEFFNRQKRNHAAGIGTDLSQGALEAANRDLQRNPLDAILNIIRDEKARADVEKAKLGPLPKLPKFEFGMGGLVLPNFNLQGGGQINFGQGQGLGALMPGFGMPGFVPGVGAGVRVPQPVPGEVPVDAALAKSNETLDMIHLGIKTLIDVTIKASGKPPVEFKGAGLN